MFMLSNPFTRSRKIAKTVIPLSIASKCINVDSGT